MDLGKIGYRVGVDDAEYYNKLKKLEQSTAQSTDKIGGMFVKLAASMGLLKVAWDGWTEAQRFSKELANIGSIANDMDMSKVRTEIENLDSRLGKSSEIANGVYFAYSAGIRGTEKELVSFSKTMAELAITIEGGVTPITDAATTLMNAYGKSVGDAGKISDWFYQVVKSGKTTGGELAQSLGSIAGTAAAAKMPMEQLGASVATLTTTMPTSIAITSLGAALRTIMNPTEETAKLAKDLGIDLSMSAIQAKGFGGVIEEIKQKTGGQADLIGKLFPAESSRAIMALTGQLDTLKQNIVDFDNNAGASAKAFEIKINNLSATMSGLYNFCVKVASELGRFAFQLVTLGGALNDTIEWFVNLDSASVRFIARILGIVTGIVLLNKTIKILSIGLNTVKTNFLASATATVTDTAATNAGTVAKGKFATATLFCKGAIKSLWATMAANPLGAILTVLGLVASVIMLIADKAEQAKQKIIDTSNEAIAKEQQLRSEMDKDNKKDLLRVQRLQQLSEKSNKSKEDIAEIDTLIGDLGGKFETIGGTFDKMSGSLKLGADSMERLTKMMVNAKIESLEKENEELSKQQQPIKQEIQSFKDKTKRLSSFKVQSSSSWDTLLEDFNAFKETDRYKNYLKLQEQEAKNLKRIAEYRKFGNKTELEGLEERVTNGQKPDTSEYDRLKKESDRLKLQNSLNKDGNFSLEDQFELNEHDLKIEKERAKSAGKSADALAKKQKKGSLEYIKALNEQERALSKVYELEKERKKLLKEKKRLAVEEVKKAKDLAKEQRTYVANERLAAAWADGQVTAEEERALAKADIADQQQRITELAKEAKNAASSEFKKSIHNSINLAKIELGKLEANFKNTGGTINNSTASVTHDASLARLITGGNTAAERTAKATEESALRLKYIKDNTKTTNTTQGVTAT